MRKLKTGGFSKRIQRRIDIVEKNWRKMDNIQLEAEIRKVQGSCPRGRVEEILRYLFREGIIPREEYEARKRVHIDKGRKKLKAAGERKFQADKEFIRNALRMRRTMAWIGKHVSYRNIKPAIGQLLKEEKITQEQVDYSKKKRFFA